MIDFSSNNPSNPSYFYPVILTLISALGLLNLIIYICKNNSKVTGVMTDSQTFNESRNLIKKKNSLRFRYLLAYTLTRASVWSKSPYLYTMYNKYHGFAIDEIGVLYVIDAVTALITGPILGNMADKYGRKLFCMNYCILVIANLSLRSTGIKSLAYIAQVLTGLGAGLIMTTFESWVNYEAKKDFGDNDTARERFLKKLFKSQNLFDALTSLCVSSIAATLFTYYGILAPIYLSICLAIMAMFTISILWKENKPNEGQEYILYITQELLLINQ